MSEYKDFDSTGLNKSEAYFGNKRFKEYQEKYTIESVSDLSLLQELVFLEIVQRRYREKIAKLGADKKVESSAVPSHIAEAMENNLKQMMSIQDRLGCFTEKKADDPFQYIQTLKKKYEKWMEENQLSRTYPCQHCGQMNLLKMRVDKFESIKHPFFKDKVLCNEGLIRLYRNGRLNKEEVASVLGCHVDYVVELIERWPDLGK